MRQVERRRAALGLTAAIALAPALAQASPVLFVGRDEALRTSRVTQVALLRDGDRTVVSIPSFARLPMTIGASGAPQSERVWR